MHIRYKGTQVSAAEAPGLVVAPHTSLLDGVLVFVLNEAPSVVAKHEVINMPIMGGEYLPRGSHAKQYTAINVSRAHYSSIYPCYLTI